VNRSSSQNSVVSSVPTKETKGKRVMSGEQNLEFFKMLVAAGLQSARLQAGHAEENVDTVTTPRSRTIPSVVLYETSQKGDGISRAPSSGYSVASNRPGSFTFPQTVTNSPSADWLSMTSTREPVSRFSSFTASEYAHQPHVKPRHTSSSFINFDSSRSPTEEYYGKLFNPSVEHLSRQSSQQTFSTLNRHRSRSARSSYRQISFTAQSRSTPSSSRQISLTAAQPRSSQRQHSLTAHPSSWAKGQSVTGTVPPPPPPLRPPRNPMRSVRVPEVYSAPLQPPAIYSLPPAEPGIGRKWDEGAETQGHMGELSLPKSGRERKVLERIKSVGRAPHRRTPTPTRAYHAQKASLTTEPLVIATGEAQRQYVAATQIEIVQDFPSPPSPTESASIYSGSTHDSRILQYPVGAVWTVL
jgi:hypothetical protein